MNKSNKEGRLPVLNEDYQYCYHHGQYSYFGPIDEWEDMQKLVGHTVRYHPLDASGEPITYVILEGQIVQVDLTIDGRDESVYLVLEPELVSTLFYSHYNAPKQSQFRQAHVRKNHIYYAQPLDAKDDKYYGV